MNCDKITLVNSDFLVLDMKLIWGIFVLIIHEIAISFIFKFLFQLYFTILHKSENMEQNNIYIYIDGFVLNNKDTLK